MNCCVQSPTIAYEAVADAPINGCPCAGAILNEESVASGGVGDDVGDVVGVMVGEVLGDVAGLGVPGTAELPPPPPHALSSAIAINATA